MDWNRNGNENTNGQVSGQVTSQRQDYQLKPQDLNDCDSSIRTNAHSGNENLNVFRHGLFLGDSTEGMSALRARQLQADSLNQSIISNASSVLFSVSQQQTQKSNSSQYPQRLPSEVSLKPVSSSEPVRCKQCLYTYS